MQVNLTNAGFTKQQPSLQNIQFRPNPQVAILTPKRQGQNGEFFAHHPHQQSEKPMYKSTIQPSNPLHDQTSQTYSFGLGKLASMGRNIHQTENQSNKFQQRSTVIQQQQAKPLAFRNDKPFKPKMASSMMFFNKSHQKNVNFPLFPNSPMNQNEEGKGIESLMTKAKIVQQEIETSQTPQDKRTRQIFEIKQQMDKLTYRFDCFRPKNAPTFVPPQQSQQITELSFMKNSSQKTQNPLETNSGCLSLNKSQSEQNVNNFTVNPQKSPIFSSIILTENQINSNNGHYIKQNNILETSVLSKKNSSSSITTNASIGSEAPYFKEQINMFKKKNAYVEPQSQQTNQNLLKMLGINLKTQQRTSFKQPKSCDQRQTLSPPKKFTKNGFKIGKKMGKGQFGEVMLVQHKLTGFLCGMKTMSKKQIKADKYENQIARELSIQFYLSHRNVAPLYGYFEDAQNLYLLVEFCTDGQLLEMIRKKRRMQENQVSPIIRQICQGLDYIHKQEIIHRDVKPENILFNFGTVKISDFGWAVHCGKGMRKTISGSPLYYSPQIVLETQYDEKIDIWSIGMMAYECLLGKIPFRIYSELDLNRIVQDQIKFPDYVDVTDQAKDFILKIMKKKPEQRMQIKEILRHPFITKYHKQRRIAPQILQQFRKTLSL